MKPGLITSPGTVVSTKLRPSRCCITRVKPQRASFSDMDLIFYILEGKTIKLGMNLTKPIVIKIV